jgi:UDP-N-acetylglucosamine 2-epimerase (non-hydrolysing)
MKIAPIMKEIAKYPQITPLLVHTDQHYDFELSKVFFRDLEIPEPDFHFEAGSSGHAKQTANIMIKFEELLYQQSPDLVLVVGDVNSTMSAALASAKLNVPVAHVEAGLRSFDRRMPEEINRIVTDVLSDYLFATSQAACENLKREGIAKEKIFLVGDVMIDTLLTNKDKIEKSDAYSRLGLGDASFAVLTLHRPGNVDDKKILEAVVQALDAVQKRIKIVFPVHPRTKKSFKSFGLDRRLDAQKNLIITKPLCYIDFLGLVRRSRFVLTDSGSLQTETSVLGIPCLTLRENTERPETITAGSNKIVGLNPDSIIKHSIDILENRYKKIDAMDMHDGNASKRILEAIAKSYGLRRIK